MRACRERRSIVKYTFSLASPSSRGRFPIPCHTPRLRSSRASKTHKARGWCRERVETRGRREILSRATASKSFRFRRCLRQSSHPSRPGSSRVQRLCFSISLSLFLSFSKRYLIIIQYISPFQRLRRLSPAPAPFFQLSFSSAGTTKRDVAR